MSDKIVAYNGIKPAVVSRYDGVALGEVMLRFDPYDVPTALAREMRIFQGGGDSFMSGVLAALLKGKDLATAVQWGAAHGILVQETPGDIMMIDERAVLAEVNRALTAGGVKASR